MLQNAIPLRKSSRWPPNISDEHVSCTAPATRNTSLQILFQSPTPANILETATKPSRLLTLGRVQNPCACYTKNASTSKSGVNMWCFSILTSKCLSRHNCTFSTSQLPKVVRTCGVFNVLTSKPASCHNGVQFFISHPPRWLCTGRPPEPQTIGKT